MSSDTPMYVDTPLSLIPTPKFETGKVSKFQVGDALFWLIVAKRKSIPKDDPFTIEASHMALSHNSFIRGFNSIYQQATRVQQPVDRVDFAGYCLAWIDCVSAHHHYEETEFFPNVNKAAGETGLMAGAVHQHEEFYGGIEKMKSYLIEKGADFSGDELIEIMESFKTALHEHLKAEPGEIVALAKYSTADKPIDILGIAEAAGQCDYSRLLLVYDFDTLLGKKQVNLGFMFNTLPVFFLNMETVKFEGGMWHGVFPPLKGLAKTIMNKAVPSKQLLDMISTPSRTSIPYLQPIEQRLCRMQVLI